jgi:hypothetical protein
MGSDDWAVTMRVNIGAAAPASFTRRREICFAGLGGANHRRHSVTIYYPFTASPLPPPGGC